MRDGEGREGEWTDGWTEDRGKKEREMKDGEG